MATEASYKGHRMEDIEQGKTLEGSMKIVGEVSGVVLMVVAPVRAGGVKGLGRTGADARAASGNPVAVRAVGPSEPSITLSLERGGLPRNKGELIEAKTAHNVIEVEAPNRYDARTRSIIRLGNSAGNGISRKPRSTKILSTSRSTTPSLGRRRPRRRRRSWPLTAHNRAVSAEFRAGSALSRTGPNTVARTPRP